MVSNLAEINKDKSTWQHGLGTKPHSPAKFESYGGFQKAGTAYTIIIMKGHSILAIHQNGSKAVIAPSATYEAAVHLSCSISDFWRTGRNNQNHGE